MVVWLAALVHAGSVEDAQRIERLVIPMAAALTAAAGRMERWFDLGVISDHPRFQGCLRCHHRRGRLRRHHAMASSVSLAVS